MRFLPSFVVLASFVFSSIVLATPSPNTQICYQSKIDLPITLSKSQEGFKKAMDQTVVNAQVQYTDMLSNLSIPESACHKDNYFHATYRIFSAPANYVSLRLSIESSFYMNAHPYSYFETLNYDVKNQRVLSFNSLFIEPEQALNILSNYTQQALINSLTPGKNNQEQIAIREMIKSGTLPKAQNFSQWNLLNKSILITFEPGQVAARVYGKQEVTVPFSLLQNVLKEPFKLKPEELKQKQKN